MLHKNMEVKLAWERFSRVNSACTEVFYSHIQSRGEGEENPEIIRIAWPCAVLHGSRKQRSVKKTQTDFLPSLCLLQVDFLLRLGFKGTTKTFCNSLTLEKLRSTLWESQRNSILTSPMEKCFSKIAPGVIKSSDLLELVCFHSRLSVCICKPCVWNRCPRNQNNLAQLPPLSCTCCLLICQIRFCQIHVTVRQDTVEPSGY